MSLLRIAFGALGGVALAASSAFAADIAAIPPPPVWGLYFGGGVCYDWADFDVDKNVYKKNRRGNEVWKLDHHKSKSFEGDAQAWCGTVQVGYDYQIDPLWVVGVFASYDWQKKEGDLFELKKRRHGTQLGTYDLGNVWLGNIATVGGRAGLLVDPKVLVYALAGWSWSTGGFDFKWGPGLSGALNGPTVGAGVEALLTKNISARVEYRLTDFGSLSKTKTEYCEKKETIASITDQSVRLVLAYRP